MSTRAISVVGMDGLPADVRALTTLTDPDYADLYTATTSAEGRPAERWARAVLEEAPLSRRSAYRLWRFLGLRLGPQGAPGHVQGWVIADQGDEWIRLETASWYMTVQAILRSAGTTVSVSLFLRYDHPVAPLVWAPVSVMHQRAVPIMLRQGVTVVEADTR